MPSAPQHLPETNQTLKLLYEMLRIRRIEERIAERYAAEQEMRCPMHLCIGQEAIAVGVCSALRTDDLVFSNHRAHGHYLAKGGDLPAMIAELYGRSTGCCGGRGGSMHLIDLDVGFMGATPIVGGTVPLAVGSAWATQLKGKDQVSVIFLGDGCMEEGVVHESLNFAALHRLPVLFVCEDNDFSVYTKRKDRQPKRPLADLARAHAIDPLRGDGNDVENVARLAEQAVGQARSGYGPQFIELKAYRWREHCGPNFDDELNYRDQEEIRAGLSACPIESLQGRIPPASLAECETQIAKEIDAAFAFALSSPKPSLTDAQGKVYA